MHDSLSEMRPVEWQQLDLPICTAKEFKIKVKSHKICSLKS